MPSSWANNWLSQGWKKGASKNRLQRLTSGTSCCKFEFLTLKVPLLCNRLSDFHETKSVLKLALCLFLIRSIRHDSRSFSLMPKKKFTPYFNRALKTKFCRFSFNFLSFLVLKERPFKVHYFLYRGGVLLVCRAHSLYDYSMLKCQSLAAQNFETTELIFTNLKSIAELITVLSIMSKI